MTPATVRQRLKNDPNYRIEAILVNNLPAVIENLRSMGFDVDTEEGVWETFQHLVDNAEDGEQMIRESLKVDFIPENATDELEMALEQMARNGELGNFGGRNSGGMQTMSTDYGDDSGGSGGSDLDYTDWLRGLGAGLSGVFGGESQPTDPGTPYGSQPPPRRKSTNWTPWIVAGVLLLILFVFIMMNKK